MGGPWGRRARQQPLAKEEPVEYKAGNSPGIVHDDLLA